MICCVLLVQVSVVLFMVNRLGLKPQVLSGAGMELLWETWLWFVYLAVGCCAVLVTGRWLKKSRGEGEWLELS